MKIKYRPDSVLIFIGVIFAFFGVLMIVISFLMTKSWNDFKEISVPVTAYITDIETIRSASEDGDTHRVYISYEYGGSTYSGRLDYYTSSMREGMPVEIRVSTVDPYEIKSDPSGFGWILAIFIVVFGGIGVGFLGSQLVKYIKIRGLVQRDLYVYCTEWQEFRSNVRVNNMIYRCIHAYYDSGYNKYEFISGAYPPDECPLMPGESVTVYVDVENDPKTYYVDLSDKRL